MTRLRFALLCSLALFVACPGKEAGKGRGRGGRGGHARPAPSVAVEAARAEAVRDVLVSHAALEPESHVDVPARGSGEVREVLVEAGDVVAKGAVLLRLDPERADLRMEEATLALEQAKTSRARTEGLSKKGLATTEEVEQAREAVEQAALALKGAALERRDTEVRSPIAGVVTERLIDVGDVLDAGTVAFRVADRDPLLIRARVPEADAERVAVGQRARGTLGEESAELWGEVLRVAPLVDQGSGTVVATVAVSKGAEQVRIGRFVTCEIVVAERPQAVTIPQAAVALRGEDDRVLVAERGEKGSVVRQRDVRLGVRNGPRVEVVEGLKPGDQVVVAAPDDLRDGAAVRVVVQGEAAAVEASAPAAPASAPAGKSAPTSRPAGKGPSGAR
jgi:membrane fusion protein (multidrug efflux system)